MNVHLRTLQLALAGICLLSNELAAAESGFGWVSTTDRDTKVVKAAHPEKPDCLGGTAFRIEFPTKQYQKAHLLVAVAPDHLGLGAPLAVNIVKGRSTVRDVCVSNEVLPYTSIVLRRHGKNGETSARAAPEYRIALGQWREWSESHSGEVNQTKGLDPFLRNLLSRSSADRPAEVIEFIYKGEATFFVRSQCCDQFDYVYRSDGTVLCAASGGFTGRGDGRCIDYFTSASIRKKIWPLNNEADSNVIEPTIDTKQ